MLFISHSTRDKTEALKLHTLLLEQGYDPQQLFLDSDEQSGIGAGEKWKQVLYERLKDCHVLIVLCSPNWKASQWCFAEFVYADMNGKEIFPVVIADGDIGSIASEHQAVFVTKDGDTAYERLVAALEAKQLGPKDHLPWPHHDLKDAHGRPDECPFPGLLAFDERYAAVYFGRETEIQTVLEQLNEMRRKGEPRLLMIVGGSGSGKSSLLKAGVLPRLKHRSSDTDWLILPTLRYGDLAHGDNAFFQALAEHIVDCFPATVSNKPDIKVLSEQFSNSNAAQAAVAFWESAHELSRACDCKEAAVLLAIDQFEELLSPSSGEMAAKFLRFLKAICQRPNRRLLVIGTMRSDYLDVYEHHASALQAPVFKPWRLEPFPRERLGDVIEKPAARVHVEIAPDLLERLKSDAPTADALPLLAFTLEKLFRECAGDQVIELREYEQLGGMTGAITQAVARILPKDLPKETENAVRLSFVKHLAQVNDKDEIVRLTARWSDIPAAAHPLLEQFVTERLLVKYEREDQVDVEVAHEALFRGWDTLKDWLRTSADILRWRRDVGRDQVSDRTWTGLRPVQLAVARHWPHQRHDELTKDEVTWIRNGIRGEWFRRGVVGTVGLVIIALALVAERARLDSKRNLTTSHFLLAESEIQQGQLARGIFSYWQAYEGTRSFPDDPRPQSARSLIGSLSRRLGQPLLHDGPVYAIAFSPDGRTLITGCADNAARLWDAETYQPRDPLLSHQGQVLAVAFSPNGEMVLTGSADRTAQLWKVRTGMPLGEPLHHDRRVLGVAFSPDGETVLTGSADKTARLWDVQTGRRKVDLIGHQGWVSAVAFSPDGQTVLTGSYDTTARLWDAHTGEPKGAPRKHDRGVSAVAFSPDGKTLLTGSWDKKAWLWEADTPLQKGEPLEHEGWVSSVAFSPDGQTVLTGSFDKTARLWNAATGQPRGEPMRHERWVNAAAFSPDGETVLTGSSDNTARLWDVPSAKSMWHKDSVVAIAFSPNGKKVLTGSWDWKARLWDADTGELLHVLGHERGANAVAFSPDGRTLLTGSYDKKVRLWDAETGELRRELRHGEGMTAHDDGVTAVVFSPDGETLVTGSYDQTARVWNAATGELRRTLQHEDGVTAVAFSPDGRKVLTGSADKTARLWDAQTGTLLPVKMRHEDRDGDGVTAVAFSADGETVITGSYDGTARLWDARTGEQQRTLRHDDWVTAVAFSPNSRRVLTGSFDGTARLWDARTGQPWGEPLRHEEPVFAVAFSPSEGEDWKMLTGSRDKTARIWVQSIPAADEPERLRLSVEVRTTYTLDRAGNRKRLTQAEWLDRRKKLTELGDRCDLRVYDELSEAEKQQLNRPPIE
jgi:WD40 repeat protein